MLSSGLPELSSIQDLKYVQDALQPQTTDAEATIFFTRYWISERTEITTSIILLMGASCSGENSLRMFTSMSVEVELVALYNRRMPVSGPVNCINKTNFIHESCLC